MKQKSIYSFDFNQKGSSQHFMKYEVLPGDFLIFDGNSEAAKAGRFNEPLIEFYSIVIAVDTIDNSSIRAIVTLFNLESNKTERVFPSEEYTEFRNEPVGFSGFELRIKSMVRI